MKIVLICISLTILFNTTLTATGGRPGYWLDLGVNARALGMGNAYTAVADDTAAIYGNPAGLNLIERMYVSGMLVSLFEDTQYGYLSYVIPGYSRLSWGLGIGQLITNQIPVTDINNNPTGYINETDNIYTIAVAGSVLPTNKGTLPLKYFKGNPEINLRQKTGSKTRDEIMSPQPQPIQINPDFAIGVAFKKVEKNTDTSSTGGIGADLGVLFSMSIFKTDWLRTGINLQNIVPLKISRKNLVDTLPLRINLGIAGTLFNKKIIVSSNLELEQNDVPRLSIGLEGSLGILSLRTGFDKGNVNFGFGVNTKWGGLDYAILNHSLGLSHRVSLSIGFGMTKTQVRIVRLSLTQAEKFYTEKDFTLAEVEFNKVINLDLRNTVAKTGLAKIRSIREDKTNPTLTLSYPPQNFFYVNQSSISFTGTVQDNVGLDKLTVTSSGQLVKEIVFSMKKETEFTIPINIQLGENTCILEVIDLNNNSYKQKLKIVTDTELPQINVFVPTDGLQTDKDVLMVKGIATDNTGLKSIRIADKHVPEITGQQKEFEFPYLLQPGENLIVITVTDIGGNNISEIRKVYFIRSRLTLAVADFIGKNVADMDAAIVADLVRTELVKTRAFRLTERSEMAKILTEQTFQQTGCTDQECAVKLGRLLNVDKIVIGTLSLMLGDYYLMVSLVDVETGEIVDAVTVKCKGGEELIPVAERVARYFADKFGLK